MNEPERLADGLDSEVAGLLRAAEGDVPPEPEGKQRRIRALGAGLIASTPHVRHSFPGILRTAMWVGLASTALTVVGYGVHSMSTTNHGAAIGSAATGVATGNETTVVASPDVRAVDANETSTAGAAAPTAPATAAVPSLRVDDLPAASGRAERPATTARAGRRDAREAAPGVEAELAAIDAARGALASKPASSLASIVRYRATFPDPHFVDEADAIEVQALAALGRDTEARAKAARFFEAHPKSPYTQRVRSAIAARSGSSSETR